MEKLNNYLDSTMDLLLKISEDLKINGYIPDNTDIEKIEVIATCYHLDNPTLKTKVTLTVEKEEKTCKPNYLSLEGITNYVN